MYAIPNVMNKVLPLLAIIDATAAANAADIVTNAADIVTNAADIVTNADAIVDNGTDITALESDIANIIGDVPVTIDSESQTLVKEHAYLAQTSGFVTAYYAGGYSDALLYAYVGETADPQGEGEEIGRSKTVSSGIPFTSFYVGEGKYFEVKCTAAIKITWTPLISGGAAPIDNN